MSRVECRHLHTFLTSQFFGLFVLPKDGKTLLEAGERSDWRSSPVIYQRLNLPVIRLQSNSVPEEARAGHRRNIYLPFALANVET